MTITRDSITLFGVGAPAAEPRRAGRPKVAEPGIPISTRISPRDYDAIASAAARDGVSVAAYVRLTLRAAIRPPKVRGSR